jgi:carbonic anhydrase/acetyltransferase-like protein (isoleucine patch superfamily)
MISYPGALILPFKGRSPSIHPSAFVAPGARIIGDVEIGPEASIWYNCVLRGDINRIVVGARSNVQDGTIIHVEGGQPGLPVVIGEDALIGHLAVLHGCTVREGSFVGMGSVMMDGSVIEEGAMLAAGALLSPGKIISAGQLWAGRPAKFVRDLTAEQMQAMKLQVAGYVATARDHRQAVAEHLADTLLD